MSNGNKEVTLKSLELVPHYWVQYYTQDMKTNLDMPKQVGFRLVVPGIPTADEDDCWIVSAAGFFSFPNDKFFSFY